MTRFEKLCWYWSIENEYLYNCCNGNFIQFEKILSNYDYFKEKVLEPLGLNIPKEIWEKEVKKPRNVSPTYKLPYWTKWNAWMKKRFWEICGETMKKLDYTLD